MKRGRIQEEKWGGVIEYYNFSHRFVYFLSSVIFLRKLYFSSTLLSKIYSKSNHKVACMLARMKKFLFLFILLLLPLLPRLSFIFFYFTNLKRTYYFFSASGSGFLLLAFLIIYSIYIYLMLHQEKKKDSFSYIYIRHFIRKSFTRDCSKILLKTFTIVYFLIFIKFYPFL